MPTVRCLASELPRDHLVPLRDATKTWFRVSLQTFGGPAGQIAVMHRELVDERRWIGERRFLHALSYCTLLPGPEAQQLATYIGWLLNGTVGGFIAGGLFVLPGFLAIMALSVVYAAWADTAVVTAIFAGVAPAVIAIVAHAVVRVGRRALGNRALLVIAISAFGALTAFGVPFPLVVAAAGLTGYVVGRRRPDVFRAPTHSTAAPDGPPPVIPDDALSHETPSRGRTARVLVIGLAAWAVPVGVLALVLGRQHVFVQEATFFSGAALVTFGGAYAVLAYVAQQAVEVFGWLAPGEMVRGLAMAETTPGPLIQVVQFVGFMGAYRDPGSLDPWLAAVLAAVIVTWVTYVPCFLFIFLGAPYVERLRGNRSLSATLTGITAAVVGVIANLAAYFALHTLFRETGGAGAGVLRVEVPDLATARPVAVGVAVVAAVLLFQVKWSVLRTLGACAALGLVLGLAGLPVS